MHLKRYRRENIQDALRAVREDLGPSALVMSTRVVRARGVRGLFGARQFEITAALDRPAMSVPRHADDEADATPAPIPARSGARAAAEIAARLEAGGMDAALARDIVAAYPASRRRAADPAEVRALLVGQLASLASTDERFAPVEVFVGPPGAGKTTTIAKIAAHERALRGRKLALLSADGFRVGAVEQLRLYADILGSPFLTARSADELEVALDGVRRPLLLDTAGRSPSDEASRDVFRVLAGRQDVRTHLVIPATTPVSRVRDLFERFAEARPSRVVVTKLDEVGSISPILGALRTQGLPISYLGTGQDVPEHLERASGGALAAWVTGDAAGRREAVA